MMLCCSWHAVVLFAVVLNAVVLLTMQWTSNTQHDPPPPTKIHIYDIYRFPHPLYMLYTLRLHTVSSAQTMLLGCW